MIGHNSITCDQCGLLHEAQTFALAVWETMKAGWKYMATRNKRVSHHLCPECQPRYWWHDND